MEHIWHYIFNATTTSSAENHHRLFTACVLALLHILWHAIILQLPPFLPNPLPPPCPLHLPPHALPFFILTFPIHRLSFLVCKKNKQGAIKTFMRVLTIACVCVCVCDRGWRCIVCVPVVCVPLCVQQDIQKLGHIDHPGVWKLRGYQSNMV